ncbi:hypothetical protein FQZ97_743550 [compost metagenome]
MAGIAQVALAKHQLVADVVDRAAFAQQLEVPTAVHRVAIQAGAHQLVALDHQLLVDAARGVAHHDLFGVVTAGEVACAEEVDAGDLELGRGERAGVAADAELGQVRGQHLALFEQRRHQAVGDAAVRRALAHRVDARVGHGLHGVAHHDALVHVQAHALGQRRVGPDAHGHHQQVGRQLGAVLEADRLDAAVFTAHQLLRLCADQELHAALFQRLLQQLARHVVELALHQPGRHVHHAHRHAALHQAVGRFQAEQATADDDRVLVFRGRVDHGLRVGDVAVGQHACQVLAGQRQHEGVGAGGHDQAVVGRLDHVAVRIRGAHHALDAVHLGHGLARVQGHAVLGVPGPVVEDDLVQRLLTGEHRREQDAVVVGVGLGAEHRDVVEVGGDLEQFFERAHTGHAVAHHHQFGFFHRGYSSCDSLGVRCIPPPSDRCANARREPGHQKRQGYSVVPAEKPG